MKPSEMSNEELGDWLATVADHFIVGGSDIDLRVREAAARLRDSIPKPVVEVVDINSNDPRENYVLTMNRAIMGIYREKQTADAECKTLRTTLGITE